jgi:methionine aminopeptidase
MVRTLYFTKCLLTTSHKHLRCVFYQFLLIFIFILAALDKAISLCVDGAMVGAICGEVDAFIEAELLKVFSNKKSKKLERGIGFPTCLSVNEVMGHFSPIPDDDVKLVNE